MAGLSDQSFLILAALGGGPRHGYGIILDVKDLSNEEVSLSAGTLYAALDRFSEAELVKVAREDTVDGRFRRFYALTPKGRSLLSAQLTARENRLARLRGFLGGKRKVHA